MMDKLVPYYGIIKYGLVILIVGGSYFYTYSIGYDSAEQKLTAQLNEEKLKAKDEKLKEFIDLSNKYYTISQEYQSYLKTNKDTIKVIHDTKIKEIEKPIYSECIIPSSGVQNLNQSIGRLNKDREAENSK